MKYINLFFVLLLITIMPMKAMESDTIESLINQADDLIKQRDAVYDDVSQSGTLFMGIMQSFLDDSFQCTPDQEKATLVALYNWKATAITRQLIKIDTQINQLRNIPQESEEDITTTAFMQLTKDPSSFLNQLPEHLITTIKIEIDETEKAAKMALNILGKYIGVKLDNWMYKNNLVKIKNIKR